MDRFDLAERALRAMHAVLITVTFLLIAGFAVERAMQFIGVW